MVQISQRSDSGRKPSRWQIYIVVFSTVVLVLMLYTVSESDETIYFPASSSRTVEILNKNGSLTDSSSTRTPVSAKPPIDTLIDEQRGAIIGDVQFLLKYAVIGFGKCGTTSLLKWFESHPQVRTPPLEYQSMRKSPVWVVRDMHRILPSPGSYKYIAGYKCPDEIRSPDALSNIRQYWPETLLLVSIRHPVDWFTSIYNYRRIEGNQTWLDRQPAQSFVKSTDFVGTRKGEFHRHLARLGKTSMTDQKELELFSGFIDEDEMNNLPPKMPNKVFLFEMSQFADQNETRTSNLRSDLQRHLGLQQELKPVPHVRPTGMGKAPEVVTDDMKLDICTPKYQPLRNELMSIARNTSIWVREYFLASKDVVVSNRNHFEELMLAWMEDPCDKLNNE